MYWFIRSLRNEMWIHEVPENDEQADSLLLKLAEWDLDSRSRQTFAGVVDALRAISECGADTIPALEQHVAPREGSVTRPAPALVTSQSAPQSSLPQSIGGPVGPMPPRRRRGFLIGAALVLCQGSLPQPTDRQAAAKLLLSGAAGIANRQSRLMLEGAADMNLDE